MSRHPSLHISLYWEDPQVALGGNAVRFLRHGKEAFPAWLAAIDQAKQRISMEMYILASDTIGQKFAERLKAAARRGVEVRLLYDFVGCRDTSLKYFRDLRDAGVHTIVYHAYRFWRPNFWRLFRRNHRKTLVVDGELAFTGGINIADEWVEAEQGGGDWRDAAVAVEGPAGREIESAFLQTWNKRSRKRFRLAPQSLPIPAKAGNVPVAILANTELRERFAIRRAALFAIRASQKRVWICNPYFVPDRGILHSLAAAAARGVDVQIMLPLHSDTRVLDYAARASFSFLLKRGVKILQHTKVMHSKLLLVDDEFVSIGSYNMDHRSLAYNLELVANTVDENMATQTAAYFETESLECRQVDLESVLNRGPLDRLLERLCYSFRYWL
ncbi:MAG: phospholipase D-like domain-containing protein [Deltaproteobacteria bacterium]|nr:phospholipase D-like domain-containing protein [Deltaproteobacteria bacterium]